MSRLRIRECDEAIAELLLHGPLDPIDVAKVCSLQIVMKRAHEERIDE